jgi:cyclic-di-GMP phosphodiesterase, flagellum assembly factor TipF
MPFLFHVLIFLAYASGAAAVALFLPQNMPGFDANLSAVAGGVVFVACGVLHEAWTRLEERRALMAEVGQIRFSQESIREELGRARGETLGILEALQGAGKTGHNSQPNMSEVIAEVKVLENLVTQLYKHGDAPKKPAAPMPEKKPQVAERKPAPILRVATDLDSKAILDRVRQALNTGRVDLFLQPIVSLPQRRTAHYECFSRIRVGEDQILLPDQYIPIAEREGLIGAIDNMLLFRCVQLVRKHQNRMRNTGFFCNISAHSLSDKPFLRDFVEFMALNAKLAGNLVFELSQSAVNHVDDEVVRNIARLASFGFRFSLDQVSHLNMNWAELARHRVKFVKVDAAVLLEHIHQPRPGANLRELKAELNRFGIDLIAEKIESEQTLIELLDYPIAFGQGYLFGEPRLSRDDAPVEPARV